MEQNDTLTFLGFSFLDGLFWAFYAAFLGYITTYMLACGLSSSVLSIVLAVFMLMAFFGAFFWGGQCDKRGTNKKIFLPEFAGAVALAMLIWYLAGRQIMAAAVLYPLVGFLAAPLGSNLDAWMLKAFDSSADVYGRARAVGSAGYAVAMLICGRLISAKGYVMIPVMSLIFAAAVLVLASLMPEKRVSTSVRVVRPGSPKQLLKIMPYMTMVIILFLSGIAVSPIQNLKIVILESVGGDVSSLGMDAFIGVMLQAVFIFVSGSLKRIPAYVRLVMMCLCTLATMLLTYFAVAPFMVIIGTVMNNIGYGIVLPTSREITQKTVPADLRNTAYSLSDAVFGSFAGVIALTYSGILMDTFGARSVALLGCCIMIVPLALASVSMLKNRKNDA